jgi:hypothetical protein
MFLGVWLVVALVGRLERKMRQFTTSVYISLPEFLHEKVNNLEMIMRILFDDI